MTFKTNNNEFLAVGVPLEASDFQITDFREHPSLYFKADFGTFPGVGRYTDLPPGDWEIFGVLDVKTDKLVLSHDAEIPEESGLLQSNTLAHVRTSNFTHCVVSELKKEYPLEELPDRILILRLIASGGTRVALSPVGDK